MRRYLLILICALFSCSILTAGDWTRFRGPHGHGNSEEKNLPESWNKEKNLRWTVDLPGRGLSSPVIADGRLYLTACSDYKSRRLHVLSFDAKSGKKLWERRFTATGSTASHPKTNMASCTPVTNGKQVFALFATGDLAALDKEGNLLWYRSLVGDYPKITNQVGMASSSALAGNVLLVPMDSADESFVAGIDTETGKNLWKRKRPKEINWTTPIVRTENGQSQAIFQTRKDVIAVDPKTGRSVWELKDVSLSASVCPIAVNDIVFLSGRPFIAIRPKANGAKPDEVWKSNRLSSGYSSPAYHDGKLYVLTQQGVRCANAKNGEELWRARAAGPFSSSPVIADGKLYAANEKGIVFVIDITGEKPKELSKNDLKEDILATPSIADGAIYFRSDKHLWCVSRTK